MLNFLLQVLREAWSILEDASIFLLAGFVLAGALAVLVPAETFIRHLGTGRIRSVLWGSSLGAPLPLCSCGVLPTALALHRQGATDGATVAFLVATPETGLDSIAVSYSLTDPLLTVARPVAGVVAAIGAGIAANFAGGRRSAEDDASLRDVAGPREWTCRVHPGTPLGADPGSPFVCDDPCMKRDGATGSGIWNAVNEAARRIGRYAFRDLLDDTSHWLVLGILLSAIVATALPAAVVERYLGGGLGSMLAMVVLGIPIYTCASSSTPVAAALVLKGLSPGAALVFLLTGPATNLGSLVVLLRFLGARVVAVYLGVTVALALLAGLALNALYHVWGLNPRATFGGGAELLPQPVRVAGAVIFLGLLLDSLRRAPVPREWSWVGARIGRLTGLSISAPRAVIAALAAVVLLYLGSGLFEVGPGEIGIASRLGRIVAADLAPGLHMRLPWPLGSDQIVEMDRVRRMEFGLPRSAAAETGLRGAPRQDLMFGTPGVLKTGGVVFRKEPPAEESFFLTGDNNLIDLRFALQYRVKDARAFVLDVGDPEALVRSLTLAAMREAIATSGIDAVYTTARSGLERQVAHAVQESLDRNRSGVEVVSVRLLYVHPPDEVHDAFRDVASAQEDKLRTVNRAETFAIEKINQGKGEAAAMMEQARGFQNDRVRRAEGDAAAFTVRLDSYKKAPALTEFRLRLEAAEAVLSGAQKIVTPGAGAVKDIDLWLSRPFRPAGDGK